MHITYKQVNKITFPAYLLPHDNIYTRDRILFIGDLVLDDKNIKKDSLGLRRVLSPFNDKMFKLKKAVFTHLGLIKNKTGTAYIDSVGKVFIYDKTIWCRQVSHKIKRVDKKITHCELWCHGISFPFKIPRPPADSALWANILYLRGAPWILYSYSEEKQKTTKRKV